MFLKAQSSRVFENVVQQIEDAILSGEYSPGDRLPSEKELLQVMDVSRGTMRESLRALEQRGLIRIKQGAKGGIYVRESNTEHLTQSLDLFMRSQRVTHDQLAQFREDLEGMVAGRAARLATSQGLRKLDNLIEKAEQQTKTGASSWDEFMSGDRKVHLAIAEMARNPLHSFFLETVYNYFHGPNVDAYLPHTQEIMRVNLKSLKCIVNAIKDGDQEQAKAMAIQHVRRFNGFMTQKGGELKTASPGQAGIKRSPH
jgi:GntR family transcriptional repressor for pyruvate dehydrogenase complex